MLKNKYYEDDSNKENINRNKVTFRGQIHSDITCEQLEPPKKFQGISTSKAPGIPLKARRHSTSDVNENKAFIKTRFTIYDDTRNIKKVAVEKPLPKNPEKFIEKVQEKNLAAPVEKKVAKVSAVDTLSVEAAYNLQYKHDFVRYQRTLHEKKYISTKFVNTTVDQRSLIIKYLIKMAAYHKYPTFILYQAVKIFDYYIKKADVSVNELQIVALAAFWIALKKDLTADNIPAASTIMEYAGSRFENDTKPLIEYERKVLIVLNFDLSFADPYSLLALYLITIDDVLNLTSQKIQEIYYCGSYLMDLSVLHDKIYHICPLHLAAVSAEIALALSISYVENLMAPEWSYWREKIFNTDPVIREYRSSDASINYVKNQLIQKVLLSASPDTDFHVVYKKYNTTRYGRVSKTLVSKVRSLYIQKMNEPNNVGKPVIF